MCVLDLVGRDRSVVNVGTILWINYVQFFAFGPAKVRPRSCVHFIRLDFKVFFGGERIQPWKQIYELGNVDQESSALDESSVSNGLPDCPSRSSGYSQYVDSQKLSPAVH